MLIIGERINSTRTPIAKAIEAHDVSFIQNEARIQDDAGADYIDVNAGTFAEDEEDRLKWLIDTVQKVTPKPLCIDSADPKVIKSVLPQANIPPMINSISLEPEPLEILLPLIKKYRAKVIGLCQAKGKLAQTTEDKINLAQQLIDRVSEAGIPLSNLYIDPLVFPLANDVLSATATLGAISAIMGKNPEVHTTCGLTNVSFGLPKRKLINRTFLITAIASGLDSAILDPSDPGIYAALKTALMVTGKDKYCMDYIKAYNQNRLG